MIAIGSGEIFNPAGLFGKLLAWVTMGWQLIRDLFVCMLKVRELLDEERARSAQLRKEVAQADERANRVFTTEQTNLAQIAQMAAMRMENSEFKNDFLADITMCIRDGIPVPP